jgi:hypothetical protein
MISGLYLCGCSLRDRLFHMRGGFHGFRTETVLTKYNNCEHKFQVLTAKELGNVSLPRRTIPSIPILQSLARKSQRPNTLKYFDSAGFLGLRSRWDNIIPSDQGTVTPHTK